MFLFLFSVDETKGKAESGDFCPPTRDAVEGVWAETLNTEWQKKKNVVVLLGIKDYNVGIFLTAVEWFRWQWDKKKMGFVSFALWQSHQQKTLAFANATVMAVGRRNNSSL